jgi:hypothetical protein
MTRASLVDRSVGSVHTGFGLCALAANSGDAVLAAPARGGFRVRRYGDNAALDHDAGKGRVPSGPLLRSKGILQPLA